MQDLGRAAVHHMKFDPFFLLGQCFSAASYDYHTELVLDIFIAGLQTARAPISNSKALKSFLLSCSSIWSSTALKDQGLALAVHKIL